MENKRKHLEMIQAIVNRLAQSSFLLKGWNVVIVSALFTLAAKDAKPACVYLAYFPVLAFWALDAYFLSQERLYRRLYDSVRVLQEEDIDFSMDISPLRPAAPGGREAFFSRTLMTFHGAILLTIFLVTIVLHTK